MAELKNIRGNYLAQKLGNFPLDCECLNYAQKRDDISQALGCIGGDRVLLSGFNADGSGLVFVKTNECPWGEVMPVKAGSGSTLHLVSEPVRVDFSAEDVFPQAYFDRYLEYGTVYGAGAENFPVASFWKLRNNKVIYEALQAEIQVRENADNSLRDTVNSLSNSLSSEQSARDAAVQSLKETLLQQIRSEVSSASSTAASSLSTEVTALKKRIADLESSLSSQISNAQNTADTAANGLASTQYVDSKISTLTNKINDEITQRTAADNAITARVDKIEKSIVPKGVILMWSGSPATIPNGWALCDGQNGTPNLLGRFIVGATGGILDENGVMHPWPLSKSGIDVLAGETGGQKVDSVTLKVENLPPHTHSAKSYITGFKIQEKGSDDQIWVLDNGTDVNLGDEKFPVETKIENTGEGRHFNVTTIPPYYALCYIIKL